VRGGWFGAGEPVLAFMLAAGRNVPPAVMRESGGGGGLDTRWEGGIEGGGGASADKSSRSRAPLTSSTSPASAGLELAAGGCAMEPGFRVTGLGGAGSPGPRASRPSRLMVDAGFGSLSWFTDSPAPRITSLEEKREAS